MYGGTKEDEKEALLEAFKETLGVYKEHMDPKVLALFCKLWADSLGYSIDEENRV